MSKIYIEKLCEVSVTKFELSEDDVKKLSLTSKWEGKQVFRDSGGIHVQVGGARCNLGDYIVLRPDGEVQVLSQKALDALYEPKPTPKAATKSAA